MIYHELAPAVAFWVTFGIWSIGERLLIFRDHRSGRTSHGSQDAGTFLWTAGGLISGVLAGLVLALVSVFELPDPVTWLVIGLVVAWGGILLRYWSVRTLGQFFTTTIVIQPEHRVISNGPYRFVRHPSYLGMMITLIGLGLALGNLASIVAMVILPAIGFVRRITIEEATLSNSLGTSYVDYCQGRARLIPGIW